MTKEIFKIPHIDLNLEVYKNELGNIQNTKIKKAKNKKGQEVKKLSSLSVDVSKIEGLTDFQVKVYKALSKVPKGRVLTYKELAAKIGSEKSARAIGTAMRRNPVPYVIPCHRIVRADGLIGEFSAEGGSLTKAILLESEGIKLSQSRKII